MPSITGMAQLPSSISGRCCRGKVGNVIKMSRPDTTQFSPIGREDGFLHRVNIEPKLFSVSVSGLNGNPKLVERFYPSMDPELCAAARTVQDDILGLVDDLSASEKRVKGLIARFGGSSLNPGGNVSSSAEASLGFSANAALDFILPGLPKRGRAFHEAIKQLFIALEPEQGFCGTIVRTKFTGGIGEDTESVGEKAREQAMMELTDLMFDHVRVGLPELLVKIFDRSTGGLRFAIDN